MDSCGQVQSLEKVEVDRKSALSGDVLIKMLIILNGKTTTEQLFRASRIVWEGGKKEMIVFRVVLEPLEAGRG